MSALPVKGKRGIFTVPRPDLLIAIAKF